MDHETAYRLSHEWFLIGGKAPLTFRNVQLGLVTQIRFMESLFPGANTVEIGTGLRGFLKKRHWEWPVRFWHSYLVNKASVHNADILTLFDVNNLPMIDLLARASRALEAKGAKVTGIHIDAAIASQITSPSSRAPWIAAYKVRDELQVIKTTREMKRIFDSHHPEFLAILTGAGLGEKDARRLLTRQRRQIRQIIREIIALDHLLALISPERIVLASDAHRTGRVLVPLARARGISSFVLQHGAPIWKYGYVPVMADKMLLWGDAAKRWFTSHGVPEEKLLITGNPRTDEIRPTPLPAVWPEKRGLFVLPNPVGRKMTGQMIGAFIKAARNWPGQAVIKLHPSERDLSWYASLIPADLRERIEISTKSLNAAGIQPGDIAFVGNSTAGLDAVILGALIVNIEFAGLPNPIDYRKDGLGITLIAEESAAAINPLLSISLTEYGLARDTFLKEHYHILDGQSTERTANAILDNDIGDNL